MIKAKLTIPFLLPLFLSSCLSLTPGGTPYPSQEDVYGMPSPSAAATSVPGSSELGNLNAGLLPDPSLTDEEKKLAGVLVRKVSPEFPLKLGVILYNRYSGLEEKYRQNLYNSFLQKLKENGNVKQIIDISSNLVTGNSSIEDLRKLAAKFQVSTLIIIGDNYQQPQVNKEAFTTPIDIVTGLKTWESLVSINAYALDTFNGVFVFSASTDARLSDKYNNLDNLNNRDTALIKNTATKAWLELDTKVNSEINDYKNRNSTGEASVPATGS
jgi:hypothetical protein